MANQYLRNENGFAIKLIVPGSGTHILPGVVQSIQVNGEMVLESHKKEEKSGSVNVIHGYADAKINITLRLLPGTRSLDQQMTTIQKVFDVVGPKKAIRVVNPHLDARRIKTVLFKTYSTSESSDNKHIDVTLSFVDYSAEMQRLEDKNDSSGSDNGPDDPGTLGPDGKPLPGTATKTKTSDGKPKTPGFLRGVTTGTNSGSNKATAIGSMIGIVPGKK